MVLLACPWTAHRYIYLMYVKSNSPYCCKASGPSTGICDSCILEPCNPNPPVYNKHSCVTEKGSHTVLKQQISVKSNSHSWIPVSERAEVNFNSKFKTIFPRGKTSLITPILHFLAMDNDKQAGLLTNLPGKGTFSPPCLLHLLRPLHENQFGFQWQVTGSLNTGNSKPSYALKSPRKLIHRYYKIKL